MPRDLSPFILGQIATQTHNSFQCFDITLRDGVTVIRGGEIELVVSSLNLLGASVAVTPVFYPGKIAKTAAPKFTRGTSPNTGTIDIIDLDHALGINVSQLSNVLEGSRIVISNCFIKADGTAEADIYFVGVVRSAEADDDTCTVEFIADTDSRSVSVANRSLTQRCLAVYGDDRCGRPAGLIAPLETCSKIYDDPVNGCLSKRWQFRFWGVPILQLNTNLSGNGGWGSGGGGPTGGGPIGTGGGGSGGGCPDPEAFVDVYLTRGKRISLKAADVEVGMILIDSFDRCGVVEKHSIIPNIQKYDLFLDSGAWLRCSHDHPVVRSKDDVPGKVVSDLQIGENIVGFSHYSSKALSALITDIKDAGKGDVVKITLANSKTAHYNAGMEKGLTIEGHNKIDIGQYY
jgi:uncharacterized membrane protein YgcG